MATSERTIKITAIGTSICGVTAIMATSSVLKSKDNDVGIAILIVILWGSLAVLIYPFFISGISYQILQKVSF